MKIAVMLLVLLCANSANAYKFIVYYDDYIRHYDSEVVESYGMFNMTLQRICEKGRYVERIHSNSGNRDVYRKSNNGSHLECEILKETD